MIITKEKQMMLKKNVSDSQESKMDHLSKYAFVQPYDDKQQKLKNSFVVFRNDKMCTLRRIEDMSTSLVDFEFIETNFAYLNCSHHVTSENEQMIYIGTCDRYYKVLETEIIKIDTSGEVSSVGNL